MLPIRLVSKLLFMLATLQLATVVNLISNGKQKKRKGGDQLLLGLRRVVTKT